MSADQGVLRNPFHILGVVVLEKKMGNGVRKNGRKEGRKEEKRMQRVA
jgi:hypothetical protein